MRMDRSRDREAGAFRDLSLEIEQHCYWPPMTDCAPTPKGVEDRDSGNVCTSSSTAPGGSTLK